MTRPNLMRDKPQPVKYTAKLSDNTTQSAASRSANGLSSRNSSEKNLTDLDKTSSDALLNCSADYSDSGIDSMTNNSPEVMKQHSDAITTTTDTATAASSKMIASSIPSPVKPRIQINLKGLNGIPTPTPSSTARNLSNIPLPDTSPPANKGISSLECAEAVVLLDEDIPLPETSPPVSKPNTNSSVITEEESALYTPTPSKSVSTTLLPENGQQLSKSASEILRELDIFEIRPEVPVITAYPIAIKKEGRKVYDSRDRDEIRKGWQKEKSGDYEIDLSGDVELNYEGDVDRDDEVIVLTPPTRSPESVVVLTSDSEDERKNKMRKTQKSRKSSGAHSHRTYRVPDSDSEGSKSRSRSTSRNRKRRDNNRKRSESRRSRSRNRHNSPHRRKRSGSRTRRRSRSNSRTRRMRRSRSRSARRKSRSPHRRRSKSPRKGKSSKRNNRSSQSPKRNKSPKRNSRLSITPPRRARSPNVSERVRLSSPNRVAVGAAPRRRTPVKERLGPLRVSRAVSREHRGDTRSPVRSRNRQSTSPVRKQNGQRGSRSPQRQRRGSRRRSRTPSLTASVDRGRRSDSRSSRTRTNGNLSSTRGDSHSPHSRPKIPSSQTLAAELERNYKRKLNEGLSPEQSVSPPAEEIEENGAVKSKTKKKGKSDATSSKKKKRKKTKTTDESGKLPLILMFMLNV